MLLGLQKKRSSDGRTRAGLRLAFDKYVQLTIRACPLPVSMFRTFNRGRGQRSALALPLAPEFSFGFRVES